MFNFQLGFIYVTRITHHALELPPRKPARNVFQGRDDGVVENALGMLSLSISCIFDAHIYQNSVIFTLPIASLKQDEEGKRILVMVTCLRRGRHWATLDKAIRAERLAIDQQRLCGRPGILAGARCSRL